jgi:hypothetical protein
MAHAEAVKHHHVNPAIVLLIAIIAILLVAVGVLGTIVFLRSGTTPTSTPAATVSSDHWPTTAQSIAEEANGACQIETAEVASLESGWTRGMIEVPFSTPGPTLTTCWWKVESTDLVVQFQAHSRERAYRLTAVYIEVNNGVYPKCPLMDYLASPDATPGERVTVRTPLPPEIKTPGRVRIGLGSWEPA